LYPPFFEIVLYKPKDLWYNTDRRKITRPVAEHLKGSQMLIQITNIRWHKGQQEPKPTTCAIRVRMIVANKGNEDTLPS